MKLMDVIKNRRAVHDYTDAAIDRATPGSTPTLPFAPLATLLRTPPTRVTS
jgi:hypothetical protein